LPEHVEWKLNLGKTYATRHVLMKGIISDIQRFSIHDGPGIRTLIFLKGCPLSCPWCCNPETQLRDREIVFYDFKCIGCDNCVKACTRSAIIKSEKQRIDKNKCDLCGSCIETCPSGALKIIGDMMTTDQIRDLVVKDRVFYEKSGGGVTFSGGEPFVQNEFLNSVLERMKDEGIHTAVETSGYTDWSIIDKLRSKIDLFLYDLKIINPKRHLDITGVDNSPILYNLEKLASIGSNVNVRVPVIPGYTFFKNNINEIFEYTASLKNIKTVHLLPYHGYGKKKYSYSGRTYELESLEPPSEDQIKTLVKLAEKLGLECITGG
jgi:pyruvate formate lyase activating enzyme